VPACARAYASFNSARGRVFMIISSDNYDEVSAFGFTVAMDVLIWLYTLAALVGPTILSLSGSPPPTLNFEHLMKVGNRVAFCAAYTGNPPASRVTKKACTCAC